MNQNEGSYFVDRIDDDQNYGFKLSENCVVNVNKETLRSIVDEAQSTVESNSLPTLTQIFDCFRLDKNNSDNNFQVYRNESKQSFVCNDLEVVFYTEEQLPNDVCNKEIVDSGVNLAVLMYESQIQQQTEFNGFKECFYQAADIPAFVVQDGTITNIRLHLRVRKFQKDLLKGELVDFLKDLSYDKKKMVIEKYIAFLMYCYKSFITFGLSDNLFNVKMSNVFYPDVENIEFHAELVNPEKLDDARDYTSDDVIPLEFDKQECKFIPYQFYSDTTEADQERFLVMVNHINDLLTNFKNVLKFKYEDK